MRGVFDLFANSALAKSLLKSSKIKGECYLCQFMLWATKSQIQI
ncbi:MAG: hypothetical protein ACI8SJ_002189, partial [Shewanella sp.]